MPPNDNDNNNTIPPPQEQEEDKVTCDCCSEERYPDEGVHLNGEFACEDCLDDGVISVCNTCDTFVEHMIWSEWSGEAYCEDCYYERYFSCSNCEEEYPLCNRIGVYCEDCHIDIENSRSRNIRDYHDNPPLKFIHDDGSKEYDRDAWYMGLEIELEGAREVINDTINDYPGLWACSDSSLSNGAEVISHPGTLKAWNNGHMINWHYWEEAMHKAIPNQEDYGTNGIHIHISRTAFSNHKRLHSSAHQYRFLMFMQRYSRAIQHMAGRTGLYGGQWDGSRDLINRKKDAKKYDGYNYTERHRPVNTNNPNTIEVRIFDGRSDPYFVKRSYQLIAAMVEFTRGMTVRDKITWNGFVTWVHKAGEDYDQLRDYMFANSLVLSELSRASEESYVNYAIPTYKVRLEETKARQRAESESLRIARRHVRERLDDNSEHECCRYCTTYGRE